MKIETSPIVIDPRTSANITVLIKNLTYHSFLNSNTAIDYLNFDNQTICKIILTHPVFLFDKPERLSAKTGKIKKKAQYLAVYQAESLDSEEFGAIFPVIGTWKLDNGPLQFKTQSTLSKQRVVKTNALHFKPGRALDIYHGLTQEYSIGRNLPHMGYKYGVFTYNYHSFLLMRRPPGNTLHDWIKSLYKYPQIISIEDRLQITVNLLETLHSQVHNYSDPLKGPLIHKNLKPENILVDSDLNLNIKDYGLSQYQNSENEIKGEPCYLDPLLLNGEKNVNDTETDLYSVARIIAELWGDQSIFSIQSLADLRNRSTNNLTVNLLKSVEGLDKDETQKIHTMIKSMLEYESNKRPSRDKALAFFQKNLTNRLIIKSLKILNLSYKPKLDDIEVETLVFLLKSTNAQAFLKEVLNTYKNLDSLLAKLDKMLCLFDEKTLMNLVNADPCAPWSNILTKAIQDDSLSCEMTYVFKVKSIPITEEHLKCWLLEIDEQDKEVEWVKICRMLYDAYPKSEELIKTITIKSKFKSLYCQHYLNIKLPFSDEQYNATLILLHLKNLNIDNDVKSKITAALESICFKNTPLANLILSSELMTTEPDYLHIQPNSNLPRVLNALSKLKNRTPQSEQNSNQLTTVEPGNSETFLLTNSIFNPKRVRVEEKKSMLIQLSPEQPTQNQY